MNIYILYFILIITTRYVYGENIITDRECEPINTLLNKEKLNNCCKETGITCNTTGHIIEM